jgi:hypothetical protein
VLHVVYLDTHQHARRKHDSSDGKSVSVAQMCKVLEYDNGNDSGNHERPVDRGNIDLALYSFRGVKHADRRETFRVDYLLYEAEGGCDHRL